LHAAVGNVVTVRTHEPVPRSVVVDGNASATLSLAYAAHVQKAQGRTVDFAYIVSGGWQTHRESLYVAMSRSRLGSRLFLDRETLDKGIDADALAEMSRRAEESRAKQAATSYQIGAMRRGAYPPPPTPRPRRPPSARRAIPLPPVPACGACEDEVASGGRRRRAAVAGAPPATAREACRPEVMEWALRVLRG
jgi:UvrD-like helicase C-terminal domain